MKKKATVGIIGAGIIGASIAYNLVRKGETDVVVFDMGKAGSGTTAAALGGFRHQFSNELSIRMSKESIEFFNNFKELTGYDPLVKRDGYMFVAETETSIQQLQRNLKLQKSLEIDVDFVSVEYLRTELPFYNFDGILGGTFCREDGHASTLAVLQGYLSTSKQAGVQFYENTRVSGIKIANGSVQGLLAIDGEISCDKVVIAAGAYSGLVGQLAGITIPIMPVPRRVLVTSSFSEGIPRNFPLIINVDSTLAIGREGKGVVIGDNVGSTPGFDYVFPPDYDERLLTKAVEKVPALARAAIGYENQGLYEVAPDSNPIISSIPDIDGLYCCAGFSGHGFMHSPAAGELIAELLLGEKPHLDIAPIDIRRFDVPASEKEKLII